MHAWLEDQGHGLDGGQVHRIHVGWKVGPDELRATGAEQPSTPSPCLRTLWVFAELEEAGEGEAQGAGEGPPLAMSVLTRLSVAGRV